MRSAGIGDIWEITTNRYVACFDIMGFKDMVLRKTHDEIYQMMLSVGNDVEKASSIEWGPRPGSLIRTTIYSDSIVIYSKDDTYSSLQSFIMTVSLITNQLLYKSIPHTGAVAFGLMTLDEGNSIFFGQPVIDAYLLQKELEFYGVIAHATFEDEYEKKKKYGNIVCIHNYSCNFKKGNSKNLTIFPLSVALVNNDNKDFSGQYDQILEGCKKMRLSTSGHLRKYIDNTENYLNNIKDSLVNNQNRKKIED